jgi:hypothetical protein
MILGLPTLAAGRLPCPCQDLRKGEGKKILVEQQVKLASTTSKRDDQRPSRLPAPQDARDLRRSKEQSVWPGISGS